MTMICEPAQWKALPKDLKDRYEERARVIAMDSVKKISETLSTSEATPSASDSRSMSPHPNAHLTASGTLPALLTTCLSLCPR